MQEIENEGEPRTASVSLRYRLKRSIAVASLFIYFGGDALVAAVEAGDRVTQYWAAAALCVGFMFLAWVDRVKIDPARNRIVRTRGFLIPIPWTSYTLSDFTRCELRSRTKRAGDSGTRVVYDICLAAKQRRRLASMNRVFPARRAAEKIARAMQVPLHNSAFGGRSVRSANVLDTSLAERWRQSGKTFDLPELPEDSGLRIQQSGDRLSVRFAARYKNLPWILLMGLVAFGMSHLFPDNEPVPSIFFALFYAALGYHAMGSIGSSRLVFGPDYVGFRTGIAPLKQKLKLKEIEEVIVNGGMYLISDKRQLFISWPDGKEDAQFLDRLIRREILGRSAESQAAA